MFIEWDFLIKKIFNSKNYFKFDLKNRKKTHKSDVSSLKKRIFHSKPQSSEHNKLFFYLNGSYMNSCIQSKIKPQTSIRCDNINKERSIHSILYANSKKECPTSPRNKKSANGFIEIRRKRDLISLVQLTWKNMDFQFISYIKKLFLTKRDIVVLLSFHRRLFFQWKVFFLAKDKKNIEFGWKQRKQENDFRIGFGWYCKNILYFLWVYHCTVLIINETAINWYSFTQTYKKEKSSTDTKCFHAILSI